MRLGYAEQYQSACVILEPSDLPMALDVIDDTLEWAAEQGTTFDDGGDECYVAEFPRRPPELFTEQAFRGSLASGSGEMVR
jgi:hypothetical protein